MRIGSTLSGLDLTAQHHLLQALSRLDQSSLRLSTMRRINRGSDDPAGLVAVGQLQSELAAIQAASDSAARAAGAISVADAAMAEVGSLLNSVRANVVAAADGTSSDAEIAARQMEIDAALEAVNRIGSTTSFGGHKLLDGSPITFNFSPDVSQTVTLTLPEVQASALGGSAGRLSDLASGGSASLTSGNLADAIGILDAAGGQILEARAGLGAFERYTIESTSRVLGSMEENISSAVSLIYDTDVALETSRLVQSQIMVDAATSALMLTNQRPSLLAFL